MGFKAAASELGTEGGLRTRTDTDTIKAKSIRIRTYPYALETCLDCLSFGVCSARRSVKQWNPPLHAADPLVWNLVF